MMEDFELLDKLTTAYKENNKDEFTRLCIERTGAAYKNIFEDGNFHGLYVVHSAITETDSAFIEHLKQCATGEDKTTVEKIARFEEYYSYEDVPEAEKDEYEEYIENKHYGDWVTPLYCKYENEVDSALIWNNAEIIIDELSKNERDKNGI